MILYSRWCALDLATRIKIAEAFGIIKKGATEVASNVLKYDGYLVKDIEEALTLKVMQDYLQCQNDDMGFVFNLLIDKFQGRELVGLIPMDKITILPKEEVNQFNKEFKARKVVINKIIKKKNATKKNK